MSITLDLEGRAGVVAMGHGAGRCVLDLLSGSGFVEGRSDGRYVLLPLLPLLPLGARRARLSLDAINSESR